MMKVIAKKGTRFEDRKWPAFLTHTPHSHEQKRRRGEERRERA